jgi:hypothetical protein
LVGRAADSDSVVPAADVELEAVLKALTPWLVPASRNRCDGMLRLEHTLVRHAARRRYDLLWDPDIMEDDVSLGTGATRPSIPQESAQDRQGYAWVVARIWTVESKKLQVISATSHCSC